MKNAKLIIDREVINAFCGVNLSVFVYSTLKDARGCYINVSKYAEKEEDAYEFINVYPIVNARYYRDMNSGHGWTDEDGKHYETSEGTFVLRTWYGGAAVLIIHNVPDQKKEILLYMDEEFYTNRDLTNVTDSTIRQDVCKLLNWELPKSENDMSDERDKVIQILLAELNGLIKKTIAQRNRNSIDLEQCNEKILKHNEKYAMKLHLLGLTTEEVTELLNGNYLEEKSSTDSVDTDSNNGICEDTTRLEEVVNTIRGTAQQQTDTLLKEMEAKIQEIEKEYKQKIEMVNNSAESDIADVQAQYTLIMSELKKVQEMVDAIVKKY